jgi:glyoxylase-like metal-dependent hydrolase (beta-lactamase superfamily II)
MTLPSFVESLPHQIYVIDTGLVRDRFDAAYLVVSEGRAAFVDTGTTRAVPRLLAALAALGLERSAVDWVIPTHVHLDHAGGAGALLQELPSARMLVHPRGARHMIDPSALYQGALAIYGQERMDREYGRLIPAPASHVQVSSDGQVLELGRRPLRFMDTPGHAKHHHCIWDALSQGWFTGDTFGLCYPELADAHGVWSLPTTTPIQFEPELLRASIERLLSFNPRCMYLTHFGRVEMPERIAEQQLALLDNVVQLGLSLRSSPDRQRHLERGLAELYCESLREHGSLLSREAIVQLLEPDISLNASGMGVWLDRLD